MMATEMKADLKGFELLNDELENLSGIREANKKLSNEEYSVFYENEYQRLHQEKYEEHKTIFAEEMRRNFKSLSLKEKMKLSLRETKHSVFDLVFMTATSTIFVATGFLSMVAKMDNLIIAIFSTIIFFIRALIFFADIYDGKSVNQMSTQKLSALTPTLEQQSKEKANNYRQEYNTRYQAPTKLAKLLIEIGKYNKIVKELVYTAFSILNNYRIV